jgi:hypothetical protein
MIKDKNFADFESGDDDIDQEEFKRISALAQEQTRQALLRHVRENTDKRTKHVGDNVRVWDCSRLSDLQTGEIEYDSMVHATLSNYSSIVIKTDDKYIAPLTTFAGDFSKNLDLIVWNKKLNRKFRTASEFVKIID